MRGLAKAVPIAGRVIADFSKKMADTSASSGKRLEAHTGDTQPEFLQQTGREVSTQNIVDLGS